MKINKTITLLALVITLALGACVAHADTLARDAMITYSGSDAFATLEASERQACVEWLVKGGTMDQDCSNAVMKLVAKAPNAVTPEQRQALIAEASGGTSTTSTNTPSPVQEEQPQITKKNDDSGKIVAVGLIGLLAGLIIHNNVKHHKSAPSYSPAPPRPAPPTDRRPPHTSRPPQQHRPPQPPRQNQPRPPRR